MNQKTQFEEQGFALLNRIYSASEIDSIKDSIERSGKTNENFRKSSDVFAIRQFLREIPEATESIFNSGLKNVIREFAGKDFFVVKSIYFDKPESSNWYVSYHQDLTISVNSKKEINGYGPWTTKKDQYAVQPPVNLLENIVTLRIHLDDTNENNGALWVVPGSHLNGIIHSKKIERDSPDEYSCSINAGGVMLMKPLLLHSSGRTTDNRKRRVIHIEMSSMDVHPELQWAEKMSVDL